MQHVAVTSDEWTRAANASALGHPRGTGKLGPLPHRPLFMPEAQMKGLG